MATLVFEVDDDRVVAWLKETASNIDLVIEFVARDFAEAVAAEAGGVLSSLGADWSVEGSGPRERRVRAPEFYAHFFAGGTAAHGPRKAPYLVFNVAGSTVSASYVRGIDASHFDDAAALRTASHLDEILERIIR